MVKVVIVRTREQCEKKCKKAWFWRMYVYQVVWNT